MLHWNGRAINTPKTLQQHEINAITAAAGLIIMVEIKIGVL